MSADEDKETKHTKTGVVLFCIALTILFICYGMCVTIFLGGNPSEMLNHPTEMTVFAVIRMWFISGIPVTFASFVLGVLMSSMYFTFFLEEQEKVHCNDRNKAFEEYWNKIVWPFLFFPPLFVIWLWFAVSIGVYAD